MASDTHSDPDNPIIDCTVLELAFAAWQESRGASSLEQSGPSWERFHTWWCAQLSGGFASIRDVAERAWTEGQRDRLEAWWQAIVAAQPRIEMSPPKPEGAS